MIKYHQGQIMICTDKSILDKIYNSAGLPGIPVYPEKIHWVSYKVKNETLNKPSV